MSDLDQESSVASIFVAEVAAKLSDSSSSRPSHASIARGAAGVNNDERLCRGACEVSSTPELKTSDIQILPDAKAAIVADVQEVVERPKLPFSETGKLVGDRHYGDYVVNARKPLKPEVINDEPAPAVTPEPTPTSAGCVLL